MIALLLTFLLNLLFCFPMFKGSFLIMLLILATIIGIIEWFIGSEGDSKLINGAAILNAVGAGVILIWLLFGSIAGSALINATDYHNIIEINRHNEDELVGNIPDLSNINQVSLMDTKSAEKLGDRTLGSLSELVSQYNVGNYYTICINGKVKKIAPLDYNGYFKWSNNRKIPGYVIVDPLNSTAEYISLENPMKYSPSAYFGEDLIRHVRLAYKSEYFGDYSFQVDDENNPYWIVTLENAHNVWYNRAPYAAVIVDAVTGEMKKYDMSEMPEWVDLIVSGNEVSELYNRHGRYVNGYFNFSETGVTQVTDDFGYITMNDDVYIYTGITSVSADESNLGFILVNSRTGKFDYYPIAGAEEYSAMGAAEGLVQNYGYKASFPSLILIDNEPTYVMVLKDNNGLVKKYAMVNYKNYTIAAEADTIDKCVIAYDKAFNGLPYNTESSNDDTSVNIVPVDVPNGCSTVKRIVFVNMDNETYTYINAANGCAYKAKFKDSHIKLVEGSVFKISEFSEIK